MSEQYQVTGAIKVINETQSFPSGFTKREFVVTTNDKFPQDIKLEATKDGCAKLDAFSLGDAVAVSFNLRGNEFNGKYYVSLGAWRIERVGSDHAQTRQVQASLPPAPTAQASDEDDTEIPF